MAADTEAGQWAVLPPAVADAMRPHLPDVVDEVIAAVRTEVPSYARPLEGAFGEGVRRGVEVALGRFLELPTAGSRALEGTDRQVYVALGRGELRQGRSLEALLAAYRVGARVAFRRFATLAREAGLEADALVPLAEATFAYIDELSAASVEGFAYEQSSRAGERDRVRRDLLTMLLTGTPDPAAAATAAAAAGWQLPEAVVAVTVTRSRAEGLATRLGPEALVGEHGDLVVALVPAPTARPAREALAKTLAGRRAVVGPPRTWAAAAASVRLAGLAGQLVDAGVLEGDPVMVDDHLATLVVHRDPELLAELAARRLAPLAEVRSGSRQRLAETLLSWLRHRGERQRVADELHVHPQTVGYRLNQLRELFGDDLADPRARFELEIVLRAAVTNPALLPS